MRECEEGTRERGQGRSGQSISSGCKGAEREGAKLGRLREEKELGV